MFPDRDCASFLRVTHHSGVHSPGMAKARIPFHPLQSEHKNISSGRFSQTRSGGLTFRRNSAYFNKVKSPVGRAGENVGLNWVHFLACFGRKRCPVAFGETRGKVDV